MAISDRSGVEHIDKLPNHIHMLYIYAPSSPQWVEGRTAALSLLAEIVRISPVPVEHTKERAYFRVAQALQLILSRTPPPFGRSPGELRFENSQLGRAAYYLARDLVRFDDDEGEQIWRNLNNFLDDERRRQRDIVDHSKQRRVHAGLPEQEPINLQFELEDGSDAAVDVNFATSIYDFVFNSLGPPPTGRKKDRPHPSLLPTGGAS